MFWAATVGALGGARRVGHVDRGRQRARATSGLAARGAGRCFGRTASAGGMVLIPWERPEHRRARRAHRARARASALHRRRRRVDLRRPDGHLLRPPRHLSPHAALGQRHACGLDTPRRGCSAICRATRTSTTTASCRSPARGSARGRIRVYFAPAPATDPDEVRIAGDTYYFVYYRYVFAYALDGTMRWGAHRRAGHHRRAGARGWALHRRRAGAAARPRSGDRPRSLVGRQQHGSRVGRSRRGGLRCWRDERHGASAARGAHREIVLDPDNRLVPARAYAVESLAEIEEPEITRDLLDSLRAAPRCPARCVKRSPRRFARVARARSFLIEALGRRYDFIEDTQAPPLEVIVPVAARDARDAGRAAARAADERSRDAGGGAPDRRAGGRRARRCVGRPRAALVPRLLSRRQLVHGERPTR